MCGRYVSPEDAAIERHYRIDRRTPHAFVRRFNVAPSTVVPVLRRADDGAVELLPARWGLIPQWWKQARLPTLSFNARSEEAADKPMWRQALRYRRCIMPAVGWYEWQERDWRTGEPLAVKQPHFIHGEGLVSFAGLLSPWTAPAGEVVLSCALMSKAAAPSVAGVHDRMPVVLAPQIQAAWIDPAMTDPQAIGAMIAQACTAFAHYPVSRLVNSAKNDSPEVLLPVG